MVKRALKSDKPVKRGLFDHVKHIRQIQDPSYYDRLSDDDRKSFNHFMIIRALSMDEDLIEDMAMLYQYFDKIPSSQFYTLLINLVPRTNKFSPWIKTRAMKHTKELLEVVGQRLNVPHYQANTYINILLRTEEGQQELVNICKAMGMSDGEIEEIFKDKKDE